MMNRIESVLKKWKERNKPINISVPEVESTEQPGMFYFVLKPGTTVFDFLDGQCCRGQSTLRAGFCQLSWVWNEAWNERRGSLLFEVEYGSVLSLNTDYKVEVRSKSGNQSYLVDGISRDSQTQNYDFDSPSYLTFFTVAAWNTKGTYYIDDVYVRKWTYNEPAWASPGSEESAGGIDFDSLLFFPRKYRGPDDLSFLELS